MGGLARALVEAPPTLRWHTARIRGRLLYSRAFGAFGAGSVLVAPLVLRGVAAIRIGARNAIYPGAWLACEDGGGPLEIGDDNYLGHRVHLHAIDPVSIGSGCVFADDVLVSSSDHERADRASVRGTGPIRIGDRVFLGQRVVVVGGVTIGSGATVGAGAVVTRDVAAGEVVAGVPARPLGTGRTPSEEAP